MTNDNVFDKKGLKTGMIITTRNGLEYVVFIDTVFQFDSELPHTIKECGFY